MKFCRREYFSDKFQENFMKFLQNFSTKNKP